MIDTGVSLKNIGGMFRSLSILFLLLLLLLLFLFVWYVVVVVVVVLFSFFFYSYIKTSERGTLEDFSFKIHESLKNIPAFY